MQIYPSFTSLFYIYLINFDFLIFLCQNIGKNLFSDPDHQKQIS